MAIFTMLIIPIHEHGSSFHLLMFSLISPFSGLYCSLERPLVTFVKFILRYFIVIEAIVNGIVFLISFSACALLVYRNAIDFCMLVLCPATLPKEFMISNSFLVNFWGSLRYRFMLYANKDSLTSSFPI
jgi:hypothetical protein